MDAKSRANFINSVAGDQKVPCPKCNTLNDAKSRFCIICGTPIAPAVNAGAEGESQETKLICTQCGTANENNSKFCIKCGAKLNHTEAGPVESEEPQSSEANNIPFAPISEPVKKPVPDVVKPEVKPVVPAAPVVEVEEEKSVFAEGLPPWDVVPPQVVVRRKRK